VLGDDTASRRRGAGQDARAILGLDELTQDALFALAGETLGAPRAARCLALAVAAPLTHRWIVTGALAGLVVGTRVLGALWWQQPHEIRLGYDRSEPGGTPDAFLARTGNPCASPRRCGSCLSALAGWAAADAADQRWGPPVDVIDESWGGVDDRVRLPAGVTLGDRLGVEYEAGGRVWADVVFTAAPASERAVTSGTRRGPLGTRLDWDSCTYCTTAHITRAWTIATDIGPIRLPGDTTGGAADPYDRPLDAHAAAVLHDWARDHGADAGVLAGPWRTNGELLHTMYRLGYPWLPEPDRWWHWEHAARATVDGDTAAADANLAELTRDSGRRPRRSPLRLTA
jgi:hypothetical protein